MSQVKPRVFITQENSQLNYAHAEEYGEIVFLTAKEVSPVPGSIINADIVAEMERKLADFDFQHDFLAPSGSPTVCGLAFMAIGRKVELAHEHDVGPKILRVLRWSNRDRVYQPITINL
jgi:hypothetical protein